MKSTFELKIENLVKHDPIRYVLKRGIITWCIEDIHGDKVELFFLKSHAKVKCDMYNAIYSLGYSIGVDASLKTLSGNPL